MNVAQRRLQLVRDVTCSCSQQELGISDDANKQIVELMSHARRQLSESFDLLTVPELLLRFAIPGIRATVLCQFSRVGPVQQTQREGQKQERRYRQSRCSGKSGYSRGRFDFDHRNVDGQHSSFRRHRNKCDQFRFTVRCDARPHPFLRSTQQVTNGRCSRCT